MSFKINSNPIVRRQTQKFLRAQKEPLFEFFLKKKKNVKSFKLRNLITRRPKKEKTRKHEKRRKRQ